MRRKKSATEAGLNGRIQTALAGLDPCRVENAVGPGTPDIAFIGGWVESKRIKARPARANSIVRVEHYVPEQRAWHVRHRRQGGRVYVVLEVGTDSKSSTTFIFDAERAASHLGVDWCWQQMAQAALFMCAPGWNGTAFRKFIDTHRFA